MILFEWLWVLSARLLYWLIRPFVWFFLARDCKRCKFHYCSVGCNAYCHKNMGDMEHCKARPWRPHFVRFKRIEKRKFFDI